MPQNVLARADGEIVDCELHPPFAYVHTLAGVLQSIDRQACGSVQTRSRPLDITHPETNMAEEQFLAMLRFEGLSRLA